MVDSSYQKRLSAVCAAAVVLRLGDVSVLAQDLSRVNQDELASFYGRMNVVVGSGARAFGMGGAFLARADDATAASWNPAGLSYLRRTEVSLVGAHNEFLQRIPRENDSITPSHPVATPVTTLDQLQGTVADFVGVAYPLRMRGRTGAVQASYQRSFSFSGSRQSEGTAETVGFLPNGATILPVAFVVEGKGGFDSFSLSSGFEVHPRLRLGVSLNRWFRGFSQSVVRPDRTITSTWDIKGTNFNFGLLFTPTPQLNLGAVLKTPFNADVWLQKTRTDRVESPRDPVTGVTPPPTDAPHDHAGEVVIRFPLVYGLGASYRVNNTTTLSADFTRTAWSKATITDFFALAQRDVPNPIDRFNTPLPFPAVEEGENGQSDTSQFRVGAEWVLRLGESGNVLLPLRAGFFRDGQPVAIRLRNASGASTTFKPTFSGFTTGVGVTVGGVLFDVAYIGEGGNVPASRRGDGIADSEKAIRYHRVFASMMVRFGHRR